MTGPTIEKIEDDLRSRVADKNGVDPEDVNPDEVSLDRIHNRKHNPKD